MFYYFVPVVFYYVYFVPVVFHFGFGGSGHFRFLFRSFRLFRWFRSGGSVPVVSGFSTCRSILVLVVPVFSDSCSGRSGCSGGFVPVVPVVSFRLFRWFRSGCSGGFVAVVSGFSTCHSIIVKYYIIISAANLLKYKLNKKFINLFLQINMCA